MFHSQMKLRVPNLGNTPSLPAFAATIRKALSLGLGLCFWLNQTLLGHGNLIWSIEGQGQFDV
jgi:hypothetical protein